MKPRISSTNPQPLEVLIHVMSWLLIFGFPLLLIGRDGEASSGTNWIEYLHHLFAPLAFGTIFYTNYSLLVPKMLLTRKRKRQYFYYNALLVVGVALMMHLSSEWLHQFSPAQGHAPAPVKMAPPPRWIFFGRDIIMMCGIVGLAAAIRMSREWVKAEAARREAERARTEAELKNLRNQLNPHFLLNTLNNIYALIAFDSDKAQQAVMELSRLLRHMLYENGQTYVPLKQEAEFIANYIELMRIRLPHEVEVKTHIQVDEESRTQIAPLIFISLIENAFKHGISPTKPSHITIALTEEREEGKVVCHITNTNFPKDSDDKSGSGIGLEQVHRRLELLYAGHYVWEKGSSPDGTLYTSELTIDIKPFDGKRV